MNGRAVLGAGVVSSSLIMSLVLMGDSLLYVVLPLYGEAFGLSLIGVGLALSLNRFVRILFYGGIAAAAARYGLRATAIVATTVAMLVTVAIAGMSGEGAFTVQRLIWGLSFAALNLVTLGYAVADPAQAARAIGLGRALIAIGPIAILTVGCWAVTWAGPRPIFLISGLAILPAIWLATRLPFLSGGSDGRRRLLPGRPDRLGSFALLLGFSMDGVFVMTLSLALQDIIGTGGAVLGTGILFAARRGVEVLLAPASGHLADRIGAGRLLGIAAAAIVAGCIAIALNEVWAGAIWVGASTITVARAILLVAAPVLVAERAAGQPGGNLGALAAFATWNDVGASVGPLAAGWMAGFLATEPMYAGLAVVQTIALWLVWPFAKAPVQSR